jgi:hypothetical protein
MRVQMKNSMHLKFLSHQMGNWHQVSQFSFLGFEAGYKKSEVTTANRFITTGLEPYKKDIRYLKEYKSVKLPYLQRILFKSVLEYYGSIKNNEITFTRLAKIL